jgi:hypothetical protein
MEKKTLETFIKKYNLDNKIDQVNWSSNAEQKTLTVKSATENKNLLVHVTWKTWEGAETADYPIADTQKIKSLLSPLGEQIKFQSVSTNGKYTSVIFSDDNCECSCALADSSVIQKVPWFKKEPDAFDVEIELTEDFIDRYTSSVNALKESEKFSLVLNKNKKIDLVLGYSSNNSNRIKIAAPVVQGKDNLDKTLHFKSEYLKSVFDCNPEMENVIMQVYNQGVAKVAFENTDFSVRYFILSELDGN